MESHKIHVPNHQPVIHFFISQEDEDDEEHISSIWWMGMEEILHHQTDG